MTKPNSKRKPEGLAQLQKALRKHRIHPEVGREPSVYYARLEASQVKELKRLARENGATVEQELENAIDAYCAGLSRREMRQVNLAIDWLNESTAEARRALEAARREARKTRAYFARKQRRSRSPARRSR